MPPVGQMQRRSVSSLHVHILFHQLERDRNPIMSQRIEKSSTSQRSTQVDSSLTLGDDWMKEKLSSHCGRH